MRITLTLVAADVDGTGDSTLGRQDRLLVLKDQMCVLPMLGVGPAPFWFWC